MPNKFYPFLLTLIVLIICYQNYALGSTLMGFDSWHPEFNFSAAFEKTLSVWQEYMGLGTQGPMSFASDLSRNLVLYLFSFFLSGSFLRYFWTFGMLLLGTLGMYFFLQISVFGRDRNFSKELSFLGALFYLFNLSTLQLFYTSFDGFMTQFGFLPLLFWSGKSLLDGYSKRKVLYFLIISFFSSSQAYTGTLFFAFLLYFFIYLFRESLIYPEVKQRLFNLTRVLVIYFLVNFYWLGPVLYSIGSGAEYVSKTTINLLSSEESFFLNQKYGDLKSILELRSFWFDSTDFNNKFGTFDPLMDEWISHLSNSNSNYIHYVLLTFVIIGFLYSLFVKKFRIFSMLFLLSVFFLTSGKEPFSIPYNFLRDNIPLLKEALRFPFTKFSILASFIYAILFTIGLSFIFDKISSLVSNQRVSKSLVIVLSSFFLSLFVLRFFPYFEGKLLNPNTKVFLPEEYSRFYSYFENRGSEERIFLAPTDKFWAWTYYDFGYRGSGFLMYGLKQPVIYRSYDVWNKTNENVYWEVSYALEKEDKQLLSNIIKKYQIKHFVIDRNNVLPATSAEDQKKYIDALQILLEDTKLIKSKNTFGKILVIETQINSGFVDLFSMLPEISAYQGLKYQDLIYNEGGDYLSLSKSELKTDTNIINYPFSYLNSLRNLENVKYQLLNNNTELKLLSGLKEGDLKYFGKNNLYSVILNREVLKLVPYNAQDSQYSITFPSSTDLIFVNNQNYLEIKNPQNKNFVLNEESVFSFYDQKGSETYLVNDFYGDKIELDSCRDNPSGSFSYQFINGNLVISATEKNQPLCIFSKLNEKVFKKGAPVSIQFNLFSSKNSYMSYCLQDTESKKCLTEGALNKENNFTFIFDPVKDSKDYTLFLFPDLSREVSDNFEIGNIIVNNFSFNSKIVAKELPKELALQNKDIIFKLNDIKIDEKIFSNLCSSTKGENENFKFENSKINFSPKKLICINLLEDEGLFKQNQTGYIAILNYSLKNEKGVPICAGGTRECLTIDKLTPGENIERLVIIPKNSQNLRVDLASIVSENSYFKVNSLKVTEVDLDGLSLMRNTGKVNYVESRKIENTRIFSWMYLISKDRLNSSKYLSLNQDNQKGWVAFCGINLCSYAGSLNSYGKVWEINGYQGLVVLLYLPQILLYLGLIILAALFIRYSCKSC